MSAPAKLTALSPLFRFLFFSIRLYYFSTCKAYNPFIFTTVKEPNRIGFEEVSKPRR